jgi:transcriptional regulator with XRE-family HTH domain
MELGNRLRARRQELGLSLRELAERVGLTASFLSQIERDLASPSIESLRKISDALEVPNFHFLV